MQLQALYLGGFFMSSQLQGKLSWNALPGPSCSPCVLPAVKGVFQGAWGAPTQGGCVGCLSGHHENAQLSPVVFSRDTASVTNEEFNHHVTLITDLFCRRKWERGHGINCMSHSYLCGAVFVLGFPWRLWRLQQHHSHPQQFSLTFPVNTMCVHNKFKTTSCFSKALYLCSRLLFSCRVTKQQ